MFSETHPVEMKVLSVSMIKEGFVWHLYFENQKAEIFQRASFLCLTAAWIVWLVLFQCCLLPGGKVRMKVWLHGVEMLPTEYPHG